MLGTSRRFKTARAVGQNGNRRFPLFIFAPSTTNELGRERTDVPTRQGEAVTKPGLMKALETAVDDAIRCGL